jgi:signal transduction histidine kinase
LEVWNEGQGVPQEKMNQLFQKFSRIQQPEESAAKGTGLGLFISRTIVERHGGRMWAEGREGQWINFIMELPKSQERSHPHESEKDIHN